MKLMSVMHDKQYHHRRYHHHNTKLHVETRSLRIITHLYCNFTGEPWTSTTIFSAVRLFVQSRTSTGKQYFSPQHHVCMCMLCRRRYDVRDVFKWCSWRWNVKMVQMPQRILVEIAEPWWIAEIKPQTTMCVYKTVKKFWNS